MPRQQIFIAVIALLIVVGLYQLPTVVVDNEDSSTFSESTETEDTEVHVIELPDSVESHLLILKDKLQASNSLKKSAIFADSLARTFLIYDYLDSAAVYAEIILGLDTTGYRELAGDVYYRIFGLAKGSAVERYGSRVREIYQSITENTPRPDLEARMAMTLVPGNDPMKGILRLRELVEENPDNLEAQYNLGLLSIQSGQFDRAVERFLVVTKLDPENVEGYFYLGVSYLETGENDKAKESFSKVMKQGNDPAIIKLVEDYLSKIN